MILTGIIPTQVWTGVAPDLPGFSLGCLGSDDEGNVYQFVKADAGGFTGAGYAVIIEPGYIGDMADTTESAPGAGRGYPVGLAMAAVAANGFGWVLRNGVGSARVAASAAKGTRLNTTATAGQLDDDGTAGAEEITGLALHAANGGAAGLVTAFVTWPYVGVTL